MHGHDQDTACSADQYTVGWICALQEEYECACRMLDEEFDGPDINETNDNNTYVFGRIGGHYVIIGCLPAGVYGTSSAAAVAKDMARSFPNLRFALMVGIGGGAPTPEKDIRLGDVVVSQPQGTLNGVVQYDLGKQLPNNKFQRTGVLNYPPAVLLGVIPEIRRCHSDPRKADKIAQHIRRMDDMPEYGRPQHDRLYNSDYIHQGGKTCERCSNDQLVQRVDRSPNSREVSIHYGIIASGNSVVKDSSIRDRYAKDPDLNILCFEMEAAGLMNNFPCLVIRGVCDYCDSHKNDEWHNYAALAAAAYAREMLLVLKPRKIDVLPPWTEVLEQVNDTISKVNTSIKCLEGGHIWENLNKWMSAPDVSTNLNSAINKRFQGTGSWLLDCEAFQQWKSGEKRALCIFGKPGCGKTILSSTIIEHLHAEADRSSEVILEFFFDFRDINKQSVDKMTRSLIMQLYAASETDRAELEVLFSKCNDGYRQPPKTSLFDTLVNMLNSGTKTKLVIDALDECNERGEFIEWAQRLISLSSTTTSFIFTSRQEEDITSGLKGCISENDWIYIQQGPVDEDIRSYTRGFIHGDNEFRRWRSRPSMLEQIEVEIMKQANGMFRWAACQLDVLKDCISPRDLKDSLASMPETLDETYARILQGIKKIHLSDAIRILQFLVYSDEPLTVEQLVDAMVVDISGDGHFDPDMRLPVPGEILRICSSLMQVVPKPETKTVTSGPQKTKRMEVHLAHFSVKEYLLSDRAEKTFLPHLRSVEARMAIAQVLLTYTEHIGHNVPERDIQHFTRSYLGARPHIPGPLFHELDFTFPLATYAASNWLPTARYVEELLLDRILQFFCDHPQVFNMWCLLYIEDGDIHYFHNPDPLYCASNTGLIRTVQALLRKGANVDGNGTETGFSTPLGAACYRGYETIVRILLKHGADPNRKSYGYRSYPLELAAEQGHDKIVQLLVDCGADLSLHNEFRDSAIEAPAQENRQEVVRTLLRLGAGVNGYDGNSGIALVNASENGHQQMVQLLIDHGADVNLPGPFGTAVAAAALNGHKDIVHQLLQNGADINIPGNIGTAISAAAMGGHEEIVRMLLLYGADVNIPDNSGRTALLHTSESGNAELVELLLLHGADVHISHHGQTALTAAASGGHENIVRALLLHGAHVNVGGDIFSGSPVQAAAGNGHMGIIRLLIDHGAEVNGTHGSHALRSASARGQYEVVQMLLSHGADPNARSPDTGTALQSASSSGHTDIVRLLIENGANVQAENDLDPEGTNLHYIIYNALHKATSGGHADVANILLDHGIDINAHNHRQETALQAACSKGKKDLVELLSRRGADLTIQGGRHGTALSIACIHGFQEIVQILISSGADVNAPDTVYGTALIAACTQGRTDAIARMLIENGADVNARGGRHGCALKAASHAPQSEALVQLLRDSGAVMVHKKKSTSDPE
ncbi:multiple ankyrin repeats single kh domain protein, putative [Paecilomyces variotii No. 5]|uniref:Multiple ankyrin repeats single kh domain protein, putative n=1 Tax=Byssochlamys spectabilis (strain No. 5 / NBRC 109023) TaxID=1356009 RepID=V5G919_BYSSN|nr:multiple ankyrin repeats single kh domain protein, putative [Paecilomyces variotii No. 5]